MTALYFCSIYRHMSWWRYVWTLPWWQKSLNNLLYIIISSWKQEFNNNFNFNLVVWKIPQQSVVVKRHHLQILFLDRPQIYNCKLMTTIVTIKNNVRQDRYDETYFTVLLIVKIHQLNYNDFDHVQYIYFLHFTECFCWKQNLLVNFGLNCPTIFLLYWWSYLSHIHLTVY